MKLFSPIALCLLLLSCSGQSQQQQWVNPGTAEPQPTTTALVDSTFDYSFPWLAEQPNVANMLQNRIQPPTGYKRPAAEPGSFSHWLRQLPLKPGKPDILTYYGDKTHRQDVHVAVLDIDIGDKDLQQCADATMRLRAEYLFATQQSDVISFNYTSGHPAKWANWKAGQRPSISGNNVSWGPKAAADGSYSNFKAYIENVFTYCGTYSLSQELASVPLNEIQAGDILVQGGFPGHAVIVLDIALHEQTGEKLFLLAQSFMPAQNIHVLKNPMNAELSPWYSVEQEGDIITPQWTFKPTDLKRF